MNLKLYLENPNAAIKYARHEVFEEVQEYLKFYRESKGFTSYEQCDQEKIRSIAQRRWQDIMDTLNENSLYLGQCTYEKHLKYVNTLRELIEKPVDNKYEIIKDWKERYPDLAHAQEKIEEQKEDAMNDDLFLAFFNELRVAANKEYLKLSLF